MIYREEVMNNPLRIIFHHPQPLKSNADSASAIRPVKMLEAFNALGYEVDIVAGHSLDRRRAIRAIKKKIKIGVEYLFVYSESSTMPTTMTEPHHLPITPWLDFGFFRFCKRWQIPIGLFYRDIYWRFDSYGKGMNPLKKFIAKAGYWFDLINYKYYVDKLYLPSIEMGNYVPLVPSDRFSVLPPGHGFDVIFVNDELKKKIDLPLKIFYVGGVSDHYKMHKIFSVVSKCKHIELTICTRKTEWDTVKSEYPPVTDNIHVVHERGSAMHLRLVAADIASIFVEPQEYRGFAAPVKLYEYLGCRKPIIATNGTLAGDFVAENSIGWSIPYDEEALIDLIDSLTEQPDSLKKIKINMNEVAKLHTWKSRASQIVSELTF